MHRDSVLHFIATCTQKNRARSERTWPQSQVNAVGALPGLTEHYEQPSRDAIYYLKGLCLNKKDP